LAPESLALSTMYFQRWVDQHSLEPFFALGRALGFRQFELSPILSPEAVAAVRPERHRVAAVHHPCPATAALQPGDSLMAADPAARERAAAAVVQSIRTAARLGAAAVVLHLGRLEDADGSCRRWRFELESRHQAGQASTAAFVATAGRLGAFLDRHEADHLERAAATLRPLAAVARQEGVRLGLETGYAADELPRPRGMAWLLAALGDDTVGAWLDTGHVGAQAAHGLTSFGAWFEAVAGRWVGVHWHDVRARRDHLVPGAGELDLAAIAGRLPAGLVHTLEVDWYHLPAELAAGLAHLRRAAGPARPAAPAPADPPVTGS
jgi:sugar phosphate isomerase/epimerase